MGCTIRSLMPCGLVRQPVVLPLETCLMSVLHAAIHRLWAAIDPFCEDACCRSKSFYFIILFCKN